MSMEMPTAEQLRCFLNRSFTLRDVRFAGGTPISDDTFVAELVRVETRTAMSARYQCYAAEFAIALNGASLPQSIYEVSLAEPTHAWQLLLAPVFSDEDERVRMEAVLHVRASSA